MKHFQKLTAAMTAAILTGTMLYSLPTNAAGKSGDVNGDALVNAKDATLILIEAARSGTNQPGKLTADEKNCADINNDGAINAIDATAILRYAAKIGTGEIKGEFEDFWRDTSKDTEPDENNYTPKYDTCKSYWLDMSKAEDYVFNGEFLVFTLQINEDIPDGHYPFTVQKTDIASWDEIRYYPEIINGEIAVGTAPNEQEPMPANNFCMKVNSTQGKQGDTVTVTVDIANNPGFCGFMIDFQYDSNAVTILEGKGGKDYENSVAVN